MGKNHRRFRYPLSTIFLSFAVTALIPVLANSPKPGRVVHFPEDASLGRLLLLDQPVNWQDRHIHGKPFGVARGAVTVPPDRLLMLATDDTIEEHARGFDRVEDDALSALIFEKTTIDDAVVAHFKHLKGVHYIDLEATDVSDKGLVYLSEMPDLAFLDISHTMVKGLTISSLSKLKNLEYLNLSYNDLDKSCFKTLAESPPPRLNNLQIAACKVDDADMPFIGKMTNLGQLDLMESRKLTDRGLACLAPLKKLFAIDLRRCAVTVPGVMRLKDLPLRDITLPADHRVLTEEKSLLKAMPQLRIHYDVNAGKRQIDLFEPLH